MPCWFFVRFPFHQRSQSGPGSIGEKCLSSKKVGSEIKNKNNNWQKQVSKYFSDRRNLVGWKLDPFAIEFFVFGQDESSIFLFRSRWRFSKNATARKIFMSWKFLSLNWTQNFPWGGSVLASHPSAPGSIPGVPNNFSKELYSFLILPKLINSPSA